MFFLLLTGFALSGQQPFIDPDFVLDFDRSVPDYSNGPYAGNGFSFDPEAGALDSRNWLLFHNTDPILDNAGNLIDPQLARGMAMGSDDLKDPGFYSFELEAGNRAFGLLQSADFSTNYLYLFFKNGSSNRVQPFYVSVDMWSYNDQDGSTTVDFGGALYIDGVYQQTVTLDGFRTPYNADPSPSWEMEQVFFQVFPDPNGREEFIDPGEELVLIWEIRSSLVGPEGISDKIALDNIRVSTELFEPENADFRQRQDGPWSDDATWEVLVPPLRDYEPYSKFSDMPGFPAPEESEVVRVNKELFVDLPLVLNEVEVEDGGNLSVPGTLRLNRIHVAPRGTLELFGSLIFSSSRNAIELDLEGTFIDRSNDLGGILFFPSNPAISSWVMRDSAFYVKTGNSDPARLITNFEGGIGSIPESAAWVYRLEDPERPPRIITGEMTYPTLIFDNANLNPFEKDLWDEWDSANLGGEEEPAFAQSLTGPAPRIKGDFIISGWDLHLNYDYDGLLPLVEGGLFVESDGRLTNEPLSQILAETGGGLEVWENVRVDGLLDFNAPRFFGMGTLYLGGEQGQRVYGASDTLRMRILELFDGSEPDTLEIPTLIQDTVFLGRTDLIVNGTDLIFDIRQRPLPVGPSPLLAYFKLANGGSVTKRFRPDTDEGFLYNIGLEYPYATFIQKQGAGYAHLSISLLDGVFENGFTGAPYAEGVVPATWVLEPNLPDGAQLTFDVGLEWFSSVELQPFDFTQVAQGRYEQGWELGDYQNLEVPNLPNYRYLYEPDLVLDGTSLFAAFSRNALLPVELVEFRAEKVDAGVELNWRTASETNNDRFEVQRAGQKLLFQTIATQTGAGTTTEPQSYTFLDDAPLPGVNYYRLRQVDLDGSFAFSPIRSVQLGASLEGWTISPNPAREEFSLVRSQPFRVATTLFLYDLSGKEVMRYPVEAGSDRIQLALPDHLSKGIYVLRWTDGSGSHASRIIVQ